MNPRTIAIAAAMAASAALAPAPAGAADATFDMQQAVLQKFISTVGTVGISGGSSTTIQIPYPGFCKVWDFIYVPCIKWTPCQAQYSWQVSVSNVTAAIIPGSIPFNGTAHAQASAGLCGVNLTASYTPAVNGVLGASWQATPQEIWVAMQTLNIEIYVSLLGYHLTLGQVNVAQFLPNPLFKQKVPLAQAFNLPAPVNKHITATVTSANLALLAGYMELTADLAFSSP
jgi:hypothetical protein